MPWRRGRRSDDAPQPPSINLSNVRDSQVATGSNNQLIQRSQGSSTSADSAALEAAMAALRDLVIVHADPGPPRDQALAHVDALSQAAEADPPDGPAIINARNWLRTAVPSAAPALATVLLHPTIDTAITAAAQIVHDTAAARSKEGDTRREEP